MTKREYREIEAFMLEKMNDSAHDSHHIYRVLGMAIEIAAHEHEVDYDILIAACLLHDIGRERQNQDINLDHAQIGGEMAYDYLTSIGWSHERAAHVKACIETHRYRKVMQPSSIEAKILFDADKLDVCGALGIARTFLYEGVISEPIYILKPSGEIELEGTDAEKSSFFQEFNYKLRHLYGQFYTSHASVVAEKRRGIAIKFYDSLLNEVQSAHTAAWEIDAILEE
jgi:uncharacterized protein